MPRVNSIEFELIHHSATQVRPTEEVIKQSLLEHPQIVQIGDCIPIKYRLSNGQPEKNSAYLRVVNLKYKRDTKYMRRVLDISDPTIASEVLPAEIEVSELSFNS